ncbi:GYD domain-containing protein [Desulfobacterota bacterium AH_259_B03_O07]|nr:GYD domain-containing protein [Desulfobacterota bacterium AH_259_B03_O07]
MATYILLSKLTPDGRKTIKERPGRIREVDREVQKMGARVVQQYATLGPYDFVNIVEAPNNETISKVSVDLCARGTVEIMTLVAIQVDSFIASLKKGSKSRAKPKAKKKAKSTKRATTSKAKRKR